MKYMPVSALPLALLILAGCSSMKVKTECDPRFDFSRAATFQWLETQPREGSIRSIELQQALNNELAWRGIRQVLDPTTADLQVTYDVRLREIEEHLTRGPDGREHPSSGVVYDRKTGTWASRTPQADISTYAYEQADIALICKDPETGNRVWAGTLQTDLNRQEPLAQQKEWLKHVARKLMRRFPRGLE